MYVYYNEMGFNRIKVHIPKLEQLRKAKTIKGRETILKKATKTFIYSICACCLNVLNGVVALTKQQQAVLKPFRNLFIQLIDHTVSLDTKRELLIKQGGDFLPKLLHIIFVYGRKTYGTHTS